MITDVVQRWRDRRTSYRPAREVVDLRHMEVAPIETDNVAKLFVARHHYEATYPAARYRFGLYEKGGWLVGVAVFSQPVNDLTTACLPGSERHEKTELGRFVLLDHVGANAESWFVARCFDALRKEGLVGLVSFSDPLARTRADGSVVTPGHVGTIYQATNGTYLGRSKPERRLLLPDGTIIHNRAMAKVRKRERGYKPIVERLIKFGAAPLGERDDSRGWLSRELPRITRVVAHPGNHKYAWVFNRRDRKHLPPSLPYPKKGSAT